LLSSLREFCSSFAVVLKPCHAKDRYRVARDPSKESIVAVKALRSCERAIANTIALPRAASFRKIYRKFAKRNDLLEISSSKEESLTSTFMNRNRKA